MDVETVKISELISPEYNPRHITPDALESLKRSLDEFGYVAPVIVNRFNNHILAGNQRITALKELGYDEVEVVYTNIEDLNREKALNIRLNNLSGDWDIGKLDTIFQDLELTGFDLTLTGFQTDNLQPFAAVEPETSTGIPESETITSDLNTGLKTESDNNNNTSEQVTKEPEKDTYAGGLTNDDVTVKIGDVYILGDHRLMCGDSSIKENIDILIDKDKIDLILTDPPYGINIVNTNGKIGGGKPVTIQPVKSESAHQSPSNERERAIDRNRRRPRHCASKTV